MNQNKNFEIRYNVYVRVALLHVYTRYFELFLVSTSFSLKCNHRETIERVPHQYEIIYKQWNYVMLEKYLVLNSIIE